MQTINTSFVAAPRWRLGDLSERKGKLIRKTNVSFNLTSPTVPLAPGESLKQEFVLFAGPERYHAAGGIRLE